MSEMHVKEIRVFFARHSKKSLWKAESPDLQGLLAFGRDRDALEESLPELVTALIEADGKRVISFHMVDPAESAWELPNNAVIASAELEAA